MVILEELSHQLSHNYRILIENKKEAKHLSQLFLYTFSKYFQELNENIKNADNIHDDVFKNFVESHIETVSNYSYDKFNKLVSQNNHAYSGDKLIVGGKILMKR